MAIYFYNIIFIDRNFMLVYKIKMKSLWIYIIIEWEEVE